MLNIPDPVKDLYKLDSCKKNFRVHFPNGEFSDITNDNVVKESVRFTESLCSQDVFKFGLTEATVIEFETVGAGNMYGMTIECSSEIDCSSLTAAQIEAIEEGEWDGEYVPLASSDIGYAFFRVPYGVFRVDSCPRDHKIMTHRKVTAYTKDIKSISEDIDVIPGTWPNKNIKLSPVKWTEAHMLKKRDMTAKNIAPYIASNRPFSFLSLINSNNSDIVNFLGISGLSTSIGAFYPAESATPQQNPIGTYAFKFDFKKHDLDEYADALFQAAMQSQPSGSWFYEAVGAANNQSRAVAIFKNNQQAFSGKTGQFSPCIYFSVEYTDYLGTWDRYTKPIFVNPGETYIVDMNSLDDFVYWRGKNGSYPVLKRVIAYANIPTAWSKTAMWSTNNASTQRDITGWANAAPFDEYQDDIIYRDSDEHGATVYYKKLNDDVEFPNIVIENTLQTRKPYGLGAYYTYANAISAKNILQDTPELFGKFLHPKRDGSIEFVELDNTSPIEIEPGEYAQMWWDEFDVEPVGTIRYAYTDDAGEDQIVDYKIGDGASGYDITNNAVLKAIENATPELIEPLLDTYFVPNLANVSFTPVDLYMQGYPYMEAGDAISVTAQDQTVCGSYALRVEYSGIQALTAQIDSQSGLSIDEDDEEDDF